MKNTSANTTIILALLAFAVLQCLPGGSAWGDSDDEETEREMTWLERARGDETKVEFYGILLDQDDQPVEGAKVHYEITRAFIKIPLKTSGTVKTKKDGRFEIHGMRASVMTINEIELKGYEYTRYLQGDNCKRIEYRSSRTEQHHPDKNRPVEFRIRRKNKDAVFLHQCGFYLELTRNPDNLWCAYDLVQPLDITMAQRNRTDYFPDLEMSGIFQEEGNKWVVSLKPGGKNIEIQSLDRKLYEAPESGYAGEVILEVPADKNACREKPFLYARIRECGMYARFEITSIFASVKKVIIEGDVFINPFGDRCLEKLNFDDGDTALSVKYSQETEKAMRNQELLSRPDFARWIKEGKAKY